VGVVREITAEERFEPRILESFDPMTQEHNQLHPTTIHTTLETGNPKQKWRTCEHESDAQRRGAD
jgi:hypothetical protein